MLPFHTHSWDIFKLLMKVDDAVVELVSRVF